MLKARSKLRYQGSLPAERVRETRPSARAPCPVRGGIGSLALPISVAPPRRVTRKRLWGHPADYSSLSGWRGFVSGATAVPGPATWASRRSSTSVRKIRCAPRQRVPPGRGWGRLRGMKGWARARRAARRPAEPAPGLRAAAHFPHKTVGREAGRETRRGANFWLGVGVARRPLFPTRGLRF